MDAQELIFENRYRAPSLRRVVRLPDPITIAAAAGLVAALIHAAVVREHLAHWWGYGVFFAGLAAAQAIAAIMIVRRPGRRLVIAILAGNAAVIGLWALSRTVGTPFLGPHAGHPEPVGFVDLAAAAAEVAQILVLAPLLGGAESPVRPVHTTRWTAAALIAVAAVGFAAPAGRVHTRFPIVDLLATGSDEIAEDPLHEQHPEELAPTPSPVEEEAVLEEPSLESCTPRLADAAGVPPKGTNGEARAIVYTHQGDLYLAAPPGASVRRLTKDGYDCGESAPVFRDAETISFFVDRTIYDLDLRTGSLRKILEGDDFLAAFAWNAAGTTVAYLTWGSEKAPPTLAVFTPASGSVRSLRTFSAGGGRCGSMDDETSITWSPDGRSLLVVATVFDFSKQTLFGVDLAGKDIIAPRLGTHALWGSEPDTVIYREFTDDRRWFSLDLNTGRSTRLPMEPGTHHAAISPDGRRIAYSNETDRPSLFVYDLIARTQRVLTRGYAAPMWLSSDAIAATQTKACLDVECGGHGEWMGADSTGVFDLSGARVDVLSVTTTIYADALFDPSAESTVPSPSPSSQPSIAPTPPESPTPTPSPSPEPSDSPTSSPESSASPTPTSVTT